MPSVAWIPVRRKAKAAQAGSDDIASYLGILTTLVLIIRSQEQAFHIDDW